MIASLNMVQIIGRIGKDTIPKTLQNGNTLCSFSCATDETYTNKSGEKEKKTEWHRIVALGKTADMCVQYLRKGRLVYIEGKIQSRRWKDQQGQDRIMTEVLALNIQFLDSGGGAYSALNRTTQEQQSTQEQPSRVEQKQDMDEMPF